MRIGKREDTVLFLRYALPCARDNLVKRGTWSPAELEKAIASVSENKVPAGKVENRFPVANAMCESIAEEKGKSEVDAAVIREYFLLRHNGVIEKRVANRETPKGFDKLACMTRAGRVLKVGEGFAIVETDLGKKRYKTNFARGLKEGDAVAVHFDYVSEKIDEETAKEMQRLLGKEKKAF